MMLSYIGTAYTGTNPAETPVEEIPIKLAKKSSTETPKIGDVISINNGFLYNKKVLIANAWSIDHTPLNKEWSPLPTKVNQISHKKIPARLPQQNQSNQG